MAASAADIAVIQAELDALLAARTEILTEGQEERINGRVVRRADLEQINAEIRQLRAKLKRMNRSGVYQLVPR